MEISVEKAEILAFQGKEPIPCEICLANRIQERVNKFTYLGYTLLYQGEVDICSGVAKYTESVGVISNVLKPSLVQRHTQLHLYTKLRLNQSYAMEAKHGQ